MPSSKSKIVHVCSECGEEYTQWQGQCTSCSQWNTIKKLNLGANSPPKKSQNKFKGYSTVDSCEVMALADVETSEQPRIFTFAEEFNRVLGGGFIPGSTILIGGNPGAGKSTLLLQTLCHLGDTIACLYVTGEESLSQIALRSQRLKLAKSKIQLCAQTNIQIICETALAQNIAIMVIDSIQVMHHSDVDSSPGSVSQVRESATYLTRFAKENNIVVLLVGHVTKEGQLAGPKMLEHCIDCSISMESTNDSRFRTLRANKNRFGAVNELGVFAMADTGLKEVKNPSAIFLNRSNVAQTGTLVTVIWEGTRPLLIEIQALVDDCAGSYPKRVTVGTDNQRLAMLLAVLHRHVGVPINDQDVFANIVGGVKVSETGADLALLLAIVSSMRNTPIAKSLCAFGEVGLTGEIRPVPSGIERLKEAAKHGFTTAILPSANAPKQQLENCRFIAVDTLREAIEKAFE